MHYFSNPSTNLTLLISNNRIKHLMHHMSKTDLWFLKYSTFPVHRLHPLVYILK